MKYYFCYYLWNGLVMSARFNEDDGKSVGTPIKAIKDCKWEITENQYKNDTLIQLAGKYPYPHMEEE